MSRYRPVACTGRALEACTHCLRHTPRPEPNRAITTPDVVNGRCLDHLEGRPRIEAVAAPRKET